MEGEKLISGEVKSLYERQDAELTAHGCSHGLDFARAEDVVKKLGIS